MALGSGNIHYQSITEAVGNYVKIHHWILRDFDYSMFTVSYHDIYTWTYFTIYSPFRKQTHWSQVDSLPNGPLIRTFDSSPIPTLTSSSMQLCAELSMLYRNNHSDIHDNHVSIVANVSWIIKIPSQTRSRWRNSDERKRFLKRFFKCDIWIVVDFMWIIAYLS